MRKYETTSGYLVKETIDGLDVFENEDFKCELRGKTLADYSYENENGDFEVNEVELEKDIELEIDW